LEIEHKIKEIEPENIYIITYSNTHLNEENKFKSPEVKIVTSELTEHKLKFLAIAAMLEDLVGGVGTI
jgi:hypothetical protein